MYDAIGRIDLKNNVSKIVILETENGVKDSYLQKARKLKQIVECLYLVRRFTKKKKKNRGRNFRIYKCYYKQYVVCSKK